MNMDRDELLLECRNKLNELVRLLECRASTPTIDLVLGETTNLIADVDAHLHAAPEYPKYGVCDKCGSDLALCCPICTTPLPLSWQAAEQGYDLVPKSAAPLNEKAATKLCNEDSKPCPPPIAGKGRGDSRCEQNGLCQRTSVENAPHLHVTVDDSGGLELSVAPAALAKRRGK